jgi:hypothetical protein
VHYKILRAALLIVFVVGLIVMIVGVVATAQDNGTSHAYGALTFARALAG